MADDNNPPNDDNSNGSGNENGNSPDLAAEVEKWKSFARKHENDAKKHLKELDTIRNANSTEQEKLLKSARDEGYNSGIAEMRHSFGGKLVAATFRASAAGRMEAKAVEALIGGLNVSSYLDDSGEVNSKAIAELVDTIAPAKKENESSDNKKTQQTSRLDLGQGNQNGAGNQGNISIGDDDALKNTLEGFFK
jgi:hypothetical protein